MKLSSRVICVVLGSAFLGLAGCGGSTVLDPFADPEDAGEETASEGGGSETSAGEDTGSTAEDAPVANDTGPRPDGTTVTDSAAGTDAIATDAIATDAIATDSIATDSVVVDSAVATDGRVDAPVPVDAGSDVRACSSFMQAQEFGGHCYVPLNTRTYLDARNFCRDTVGGHLVTITSAAEQTFLNGMLGNQDRWIGLTRETGTPATAASYKWINGETSAYANWAANEPNGSGLCVRMLPGGTWADWSCTNTEYSICERE